MNGQKLKKNREVDPETEVDHANEVDRGNEVGQESEVGRENEVDLGGEVDPEIGPGNEVVVVQGSENIDTKQNTITMAITNVCQKNWHQKEMIRNPKIVMKLKE